MSDNDNGQNNSNASADDEALQRLVEQVGDVFTRAAERLAQKEKEIAEKLGAQWGVKKVVPETATAESIDADKIGQNPYYNSILDTCWKMNKEPILIGERFVIANSWRKETIKNDSQYNKRQLIQIDPGVGFGSFHFTTKLCVKALEQFWCGGRMLDVGVGTGVLSIAANCLYPDSQIDAFDISDNAVEHARLSLSLNNLSEKISVRKATIDQYPTGVYDLVAANLLPDIILNMKMELIERLKPGGLLMLSGIQVNTKAEIISARFDWGKTTSSNIGADQIAEIFAQHGLEKVALLQEQEWAALILRATSVNTGDNNE